MGKAAYAGRAVVGERFIMMDGPMKGKSFEVPEFGVFSQSTADFMEPPQGAIPQDTTICFFRSRETGQNHFADFIECKGKRWPVQISPIGAQDALWGKHLTELEPLEIEDGER